MKASVYIQDTVLGRCLVIKKDGERLSVLFDRKNDLDQWEISIEENAIYDERAINYAPFPLENGINANALIGLIINWIN